MRKPSEIRGLYLHVPFCAHKCHYCDFFSIVDDERQGVFVDGLVAELDALDERLAAEPRDIRSIFIGGGTPTLLTVDAWRRILATLDRIAGLGPGTELTVEANPETVTDELARVLANGGVTRVSIGAQSFDPRHLKTLERWHEPANVGRSMDRFRAAGLEDINVDLIFGIPGQTPAEWQDDLDRALALAPTHLSCYSLMYEPGTPLTVRRDRGDITPIDEDDAATMYETTIACLASAGYEQYEVSAWSRPGRRCRHNMLYWTNGNWWALGPSASGHVDGYRWKNTPRLTDYLANAANPPVQDVETPAAERIVAETLMMGLRLRDGLALARLDALLAVDPAAARRRATIDRLTNEGSLEVRGEALRIPDERILVSDGIIAELI